MPTSERWTARAAWIAILLSLIAYAVATASTISSQGERIVALETTTKEYREDMKIIRQQLQDIKSRQDSEVAEQRVLHGFRPDQNPMKREAAPWR